MGELPRSEGVSLPDGHTGSSFFRHVLLEACKHFPEEFKDLKVPDAKRFKKTYGDFVVQFEAARASSPRRSEIARFVVSRTQDQLVYHNDDYEGPFVDYMKQPAQAASIETVAMSGQPGLKPSIPFRGRTYTASYLNEFARLMLDEHKLTHGAAKALNWVQRYLKEHQGVIDLTGKKFVILGASAELAPTRFLLEAGADVLWVDIQKPTQFLADRDRLAGSLSVAYDACNILTQPRRIKATIEAFASGQPVHIGMFAYAAGASQEWRLAATMNGIIRSLSPELVASVSMLISPTSAAMVQPEDLECSLEIKRRPPGWQSFLERIGTLGEAASFQCQGASVARAIVPLQGLSYQAAQYISKTLAAEVYATQGLQLEGEPKPIRVSANVAGITKTKSLQHPVFQAAFLGAKTFGVEIFEVPSTRGLSNLLTLHDLLNEELDQSKPLETLFSKQVHGGIYSRAYALDPMIRVATLMGLAKKPKLLLKLF